MEDLVISTNREPNHDDFTDLMRRSTLRLNDLVKSNESAYVKAGYEIVEQMVCSMMTECAKGTPFEDTIRLVSGHKFPDILAGHYFGTEVKSTKGNKWESFGNSIFENTRIKCIERIYLTFGKMGAPVQFLSKPYEECISGVVVDHSPRYHIDMTIQENGGNTIFEDLGKPYDEFRSLPDSIQVNLIAAKSKEKLKRGESLWWHPELENSITPQTIKLMSTLNREEREQIIAEACCYFPELFSNSHKKFSRYILWLITDKNLATGNARDGFSAGGQILFTLKSGIAIKVPAVIGRLKKYHVMIKIVILNAPPGILKDRWKVDRIENDRLQQWINIITPIISNAGKVPEESINEILETLFLK